MSSGDREGIERPSSALAPRWHTALLVTLMVTVAAIGLWLGMRGAASPAPSAPMSRIRHVYLPMLLVQWGLALYVCRIGRPRGTLTALVGRRWDSRGRAIGDIALAVLGFCVIEATELAWAHAFGARQATPVAAFLPKTAWDELAWVGVAASVGFCEELVYRGYLQVQLGAFARSRAAGIVLQALLFGLAHGEQGLSTAARFAVYGLGFGSVAAWRQGILAGVVCHTLIDLVGGLVR